MNWKDIARRLLREPLVHFITAGLLVFALLSGRAPDLGERRVVVNAQIVGTLVGRFRDSYGRLPTRDETDGLIRDWVQDQIYYREALRLGLDQSDEVVVRRMRRKMEAVAVAEAESSTPDDATLQALLDRNPARYANDPQTSFTQVYLGADSPQNRVLAETGLALLRAGKPFAGPPAPIPASFSDSSGTDIAGTFGDAFAVSLANAEPGVWQGPIVSGLGLHLVRIQARKAPQPPRLADVRQRVENDWRAAAISKARDTAYAKIASGYDIKIEPGK